MYIGVYAVRRCRRGNNINIVSGDGRILSVRCPSSGRDLELDTFPYINGRKNQKQIGLCLEIRVVTERIPTGRNGRFLHYSNRRSIRRNRDRGGRSPNRIVRLGEQSTRLIVFRTVRMMTRFRRVPVFVRPHDPSRFFIPSFVRCYGAASKIRTCTPCDVIVLVYIMVVYGALGSP